MRKGDAQAVGANYKRFQRSRESVPQQHLTAGREETG